MEKKADLLLLHGALGSKKQFNQLKKKLGEQFTIYDLNFEGHGGKESEKSFSIELFSENVLRFLQEKELQNINIFGYSMGGYVALNLALKFPDKVNQVITLGTKFNWSIEAAEAEVRLLKPEIIETKVPHFAEKLREEHAPLDWKTVMKKTAQMMLRMGGGEKLNDEDFEKIKQAVKIGVGDKDQMVSINESEKIASLLPNAELLILEGVEHAIEKINPVLLQNLISDSFSK